MLTKLIVALHHQFDSLLCLSDKSTAKFGNVFPNINNHTVPDFIGQNFTKEIRGEIVEKEDELLIHMASILKHNSFMFCKYVYMHVLTKLSTCLKNREKVLFPNENCIVTLSIDIYVHLLFTSKT